MEINLAIIDFNPGQGGGVKPSGTLEISENGVYNVYTYASASVDVHPSISLSETYISNGSYNITGEFNGGVITVDVPAPQFVTETLNVSANGTYTPGQGVDGYSQVVVDVPIDGWDQKSFTEELIGFTNIDNSASFVASSAFYQNKNIQTVNLPYATSVGNNAFQYCDSIYQVSLPVCEYIGGYAFNGCGSLSQVSLPMCSSIAGDAFGYCYSLTQVNLPVCKYIDGYAFNGCGTLSQVSLPVCKYIGWFAFKDCYSLTQVSLPMCSSIDNYAFSSCSSLTQISLPVCEYIGSFAFDFCSSLSQVILPMCSSINELAFRFCSSLSIITIGYSGVCSLYNSDVFYATQITLSTGSIYVPASLVDAYKSAENWSYFSTQIFPIE